ncbi:MAG: LysR family transcriptional regulator [Chloroflexota bacterium]|nr:LysR family transcriptional regulator [Chloroflexota bacterium]
MPSRVTPGLLRGLQTFLAVVDEGSFSAAARRLGITQPSVSEQVRTLEEHFGLPLFTRLGREIRPTVAGERLRAHTRRVLQALDELEHDLDALRSGTGGTVTIVASPVPGESVLPALLPVFQAHHPGTTVRETIADTRTAIARLLRREAELVVIGGPFRDERCTVEVLGRNPFVPVAPLDHPLARLEIVTAERLADEPLVLREEGSGARAAVTAAFEGAGIAPDRVRVVAELGSTEAVLAAVAAGLGIGFVSAFSLGSGRPTRALRALRMADLAPGRDLLLVSERGRALGGVAAAFRTFLLSDEIRARVAQAARVPDALLGAAAGRG